MTDFLCNLCGTQNTDVDPAKNIRVPGPLCSNCNSATRFRKVADTLSRAVFGGIGRIDLDDDGGLRGIGLSDAMPVSRAMDRFPGYTNTYFHKEPRLDIMQYDPEFSDLDYIVSSDVFEHTPPPHDLPIQNAYKMLSPGGTLILSVPTSATYIEHFPKLHNFEIIKMGDEYALANATRDAQLEIFRELRFHGGPGSTLEMRLYSIEEIEQQLKAAGFKEWDQVTQERPEYGIMDIVGLSTVWVARK